MKTIYPCKTMNITQSYLGNYSHEPNRNGSPFDYPIDEAGIDTGRDYFFAPCDLKIIKVYGVGTTGTNTIWMESIEEVDMPCGKDFITIMVIHPEDEDLRNYKVGQVFKQGDKMFREGKDGKASGNHFHMSVATGVIKGSGWVKNSRDAWVIFTTGRPLKPEEAFFLPGDIKVKSTGGLLFKAIPEETSSRGKIYKDKPKEVKPMGKVYKDVPDDRWSLKHLEAADKLNFINPDAAGNFKPQAALTREEAAVISVRIYEKITGKTVV